MESTFRQGIIYSLTAYLLWGILPIYWKTLGVVQAFEILSTYWFLLFDKHWFHTGSGNAGCGNYDQFQLGVVYLGCQ